MEVVSALPGQLLTSSSSNWCTLTFTQIQYFTTNSVTHLECHLSWIRNNVPYFTVYFRTAFVF